MTTHVELRRGAYHDSVSLMQVSRTVAGTPGRPGALPAEARPRRLATHVPPPTRQELGHIAEGHELSPPDDGDALADPLHLVEQVRGEHHVDAVVGGHPLDEVQHLVALHGVEAVGGLVEQQQVGVVGDGLGHLHPLALTGRHRAERAEPLLAESDEVERIARSAARLVARQADAVVAVSDAIAEEMRELGSERVAMIPNGCDFEDFEGLEYRPGERFRITHTGTFFGHRDPKPFLRALAASETDSAVAP